MQTAPYLLLLVNVKRQKSGEDAEDVSRRSHVSLSISVDKVIID